MFCPRCSTQNSDDTKFCRVCGINLATVSLALADPKQLSTIVLDKVTSAALSKRRAGVSNLIHGSGWIAASTIIAVALALFSNTNDWIFVWLGLAGWMACVGIIQSFQGINKLFEARSLESELGSGAPDAAARITHELTGTTPASLAEAPTTNKLAQPNSVTERTTDLLSQKQTH